MKKKEGFIFKKFEEENQSPFDRLFDIFKELITHTSGDFDEAINWLKELDKEYNLTNEHYTIEDFIEELKEKGYIKEEIGVDGDGNISLTAKTEQAIRQQALNQIFGKIKKNGIGNHKSNKQGQGDELTGDFRAFQFGDSIEKISVTESLKNAHINHGINDFKLSENDLVVKGDFDRIEALYFIFGYQKVIEKSNLSLTMSYSRDFTVSELGTYSGGTNEISIIL